MDGLSPEDMKFLDKKFGGVYDKMDDQHKALDRKLDGTTAEVRANRDATERVNTRLSVHLAEPCKDVVTHVKEAHNPGKRVALIAGVLGAIAAAVAILTFVLNGRS